MLTAPKIYPQLDGDEGIYQTVYMMRDLVNGAFLHPWIRERATTLVQGCHRNLLCEARTLLGWTMRSMQFVRDPTGVEALHDPVSYVEDSLRNGFRPSGDCDDLSMYLAALLKAVGHQPYFHIIDRFGSGYHHVFVWSDGIDLDPTLTHVPLGDTVKREMYFDI